MKYKVKATEARDDGFYETWKFEETDNYLDARHYANCEAARMGSADILDGETGEVIETIIYKSPEENLEEIQAARNERLKAAGVYDVFLEYLKECDRIADECEAEGYPACGVNYEIREEALQEKYPELFGENGVL